MPDCQPSQDRNFSTGIITNLLFPMRSGLRLSKRHRANIGHFNVLASKRLTFANLPVIFHYTKNRHIPNEPDFMHKIIIPGVQEIAALVTKIAFVKPLGTILPSGRIVRLESEANSFAENSSGLTASNAEWAALIRFKCFAFSHRCGRHEANV